MLNYDPIQLPSDSKTSFTWLFWTENIFL